MLRLTGVCKRFGTRQVFANVALALDAGEYVAIIGESGVGKSTLLNLIAGLERADEGSIVFDDAELTQLSDDTLTLLRRDRLGFVFQAFHVLAHLTLAQNVSLPLLLRGQAPADSEPLAAAALASVGLAGRESSMPRELSGGELQRVAIARALVGKPRLLLADEPTGNLDQENARQALALLRAQVKQHGVGGILVTHSETAAATTDRIYRLRPEGLVPVALRAR